MDHEKNQKRNYVTLYLLNSTYAAVILLFCLFLSPTSVLAQEKIESIAGQEITIKGKVVDPSKDPIIGASIFVEGTKIGTVTDIDGNFSIKAPLNATLTVSYIGYTRQKVKVSGQTMDITLLEDFTKLDEVVVVGYGQVKRANLTGAVSSLSMKEVADIPSPNLSSVLMGTMPGVNVNEATG
ncbi:MAG TPA: carboxypeptidase-like regulatory domain-containing protein, partial [Paludibacter sp.]